MTLVEFVITWGMPVRTEARVTTRTHTRVKLSGFNTTLGLYLTFKLHQEISVFSLALYFTLTLNFLILFVICMQIYLNNHSPWRTQLPNWTAPVTLRYKQITIRTLGNVVSSKYRTQFTKSFRYILKIRAQDAPPPHSDTLHTQDILCTLHVLYEQS